MSLTKTIKLPFTLHGRNGKTSAPPVLDEHNNQTSGRIDIIEHAPGTPLTFPATLADEFLAMFGKHGAVECAGVEGVDVIALAASAA